MCLKLLQRHIFFEFFGLLLGGIGIFLYRGSFRPYSLDERAAASAIAGNYSLCAIRITHPNRHTLLYLNRS